MKIYLKQIPFDGLHLSGELAPETLDCTECQSFSPVRYDLEINMNGDDILVQGEIEVSGSPICTRCMQPLPIKISIPDFAVLIEKPKDDYVDLTECIREDILLNLPAYSKCSLDAENRCPVTGESWKNLSPDTEQPPLCDRWSALDKLKLNK